MSKKELLILGAAAAVAYFMANTLSSVPVLKQAHYLGRNLGLGNGISVTPV
jgi:hypothetical protein